MTDRQQHRTRTSVQGHPLQVESVLLSVWDAGTRSLGVQAQHGNANNHHADRFAAGGCLCVLLSTQWQGDTVLRSRNAHRADDRMHAQRAKAGRHPSLILTALKLKVTLIPQAWPPSPVHSNPLGC